MSTAGLVDLEMDQGADFGVQIFWTSDGSPFKVLSPMRMEIRNSTGMVIYTLQTNDGAAETDIQTILYNSDAGLIQLMIPAADTNTFGSGNFAYDLFVTYQDNEVTNSTRLTRLIAGNVVVNKRTTRNV